MGLVATVVTFACLFGCLDSIPLTSTEANVELGLEFVYPNSAWNGIAGEFFCGGLHKVLHVNRRMKKAKIRSKNRFFI